MKTKMQLKRFSDDRLIGYHDAVSDAMMYADTLGPTIVNAVDDAFVGCINDARDELAVRGLHRYIPDAADLNKTSTKSVRYAVLAKECLMSR